MKIHSVNWESCVNVVRDLPQNRSSRHHRLEYARQWIICGHNCYMGFASEPALLETRQGEEE